MEVEEAAVDTDSSGSSLSQRFEAKLTDFEEKHQKGSIRPWTVERIKSVIDIIKNAKDLTMSNKHRRTSMEYYWMNKYDVVAEGNEERLIMKRGSTIIPRHQYFSMIKETHESSGHAGRDRMVKALKPKFYIPKKAIEIFLELCPKCQGGKHRKKGSKQPIAAHASCITPDLNNKGQIDVIDFEKCRDGEYTHVLCYEDVTTMFLVLRPMKSDRPNEVAKELMQIFTTFGAPYVLQTVSYGDGFVAEVIDELISFWPECKLVSGLPSNVKYDRRRGIEYGLLEWMKRNESTYWSLGCFHVQYEINATFDEDLGKSPYKALYGKDPKAGLTDSEIPPDVLMHVDTEEQLKELWEQCIKAQKGLNTEDKSCGTDDEVTEDVADPLEVKIEAFPFPEDEVDSD